MKPLNKRINKRKASKVTLKTHRKDSHPDMQDVLRNSTDGVSGIRPEDVKLHQQ